MDTKATAQQCPPEGSSEVAMLLRDLHLERAIVGTLPQDHRTVSRFLSLADETVDSLVAQASSGISRIIKDAGQQFRAQAGCRQLDAQESC